MTDRTTQGGTGNAEPSHTAFPEESPSTVPPEEGGGAEWRAWAAAVAVTVVIFAVGLFVLNRGGGGDDSAVAAGTSDEVSEAGGFPGGGRGAPGGFGASGEVVSIDGSTLMVEVASGGSDEVMTMTVETDEDTEVVETVEGSLADLAVDDEVMVVGEEADGVIAASTITEGGQFGGRGAGGAGRPDGLEPPEGAESPDDFEAPEGFEPGQGRPGGAGGGLVSGAIASIDGSTMVVETDDGDVTVEVGDGSIVLITEERSLADVEVGDSVQATGETQESVVAATRIQIGSLGFGGGGPGGGFSPVPDDESTD